MATPIAAPQKEMFATLQVLENRQRSVDEAKTTVGVVAVLPILIAGIPALISRTAPMTEAIELWAAAVVVTSLGIPFAWLRAHQARAKYLRGEPLRATRQELAWMEKDVQLKYAIDSLAESPSYRSNINYGLRMRDQWEAKQAAKRAPQLAKA